MTPHVVAGFAVGFGLGLYGEVVGGLLFAALAVALLIGLQVLCLVWPGLPAVGSLTARRRRWSQQSRS